MTQEPQKYIVDVAPIARLPLSRQQFFSYLCDKELTPGTLVNIPLFHRSIEGVVIGSKPDFQHVGGFELKKIYGVLAENFLTDQQLLLAQQISQYYLTSLGVVLKHFMPKRIHSRPSNQQTGIINQAIKNVSLTQEQSSAVDKIISHESKFLLFGPASSGKTEVYIYSILKLKQLDAQKQFLILLPELTLAPQAIERYQAHFKPEEIVILHSKLPKGQFYANWQKIQSGQAKIIISTRIGIFAPFQNLGLIVVDEQQDMSYKQWDMNPRYDARRGAIMLAENFKCPVVFGSATPQIESFQKTINAEFVLLQLPILPAKIMGREKLQPEIEVVDMRKEKWTDFAGKIKPNFSLLSRRLQSEISYAIANNLQTILFVNHQGMSAFSVCSSCKEVLKCPKCERALVYDESGNYKCLHCNFASDIIPSCKACGNLVFQNVGIGTQGVAREIKKMFPRTRVARLDTAATKKPGVQEAAFKDFSEHKIDVLIGTQMITKGWDNPNVGLVAVIDADSLFAFPDYLTDERAFANIMQTAGRTGRVGSKYPGQVIIQTFNPQNPVFDFVVKRDYLSFFQKEVSQRESLHYPPFGKIIKLIFQETDLAKAQKEASKVYELLNKASSEFPALRITEPSAPLVSKVRGKNRLQIIIKNKDVNSSLPGTLKKIIGSLSSSWIVDVDPISIA